MSALIWIFVLVPLLGAAVVALSPEPRRWPVLGSLFAAAALVALGVAAAADPGLVAGRAGLVVTLAGDAVMTLGLLLAQPRRGMLRRDVALPLLALAANTTVLLAEDTRLLVAAWIAVPLAGFLALRGPTAREERARRVIGTYLLGGALPLVAAAALYALYAHRAGAAHPFAWTSFHATQLPPWARAFVPALIVVAASVRLGVAPLHSWVPTLADSVNVGTVVSFLSAQAAVHVLVRLGLAPIQFLPGELAIATGLGLFAALYGAVLAVSQRRLRRTIAFVAVSQSGALLVGLASANVVSVTGALTQALAVSLTTKSLLLATAALEARVGIVDLRSFGGMARAVPRLAVASIVLALAAAGIPGSLGFVGEDLLMQGLIDSHPFVALVLLIATAIAAIALLRAVMRAFFGPPPPWAGTVPDLAGREKWLLGLVLVVVGLGLWPRPIVHAQERDAAPLVAAEGGDPGAH